MKGKCYICGEPAYSYYECKVGFGMSYCAKYNNIPFCKKCYFLIGKINNKYKISYAPDIIRPIIDAMKAGYEFANKGVSNE